MEAVDRMVATDRAKICVSCPKNIQGGFLESVTGAIGQLIKDTLSLKEKASLKTEYDDRLGTCDACGCSLPLKIWVPGSEIKTNLQPGDLDQLDPRCWILKL